MNFDQSYSILGRIVTLHTTNLGSIRHLHMVLRAHQKLFLSEELWITPNHWQVCDPKNQTKVNKWKDEVGQKYSALSSSACLVHCQLGSIPGTWYVSPNTPGVLHDCRTRIIPEKLQIWPQNKKNMILTLFLKCLSTVF